MDYYDEIARVAYDIFEREGMVHGRHIDHWVEAEIIVTTRYKGNNKTEQENAEVSKPKRKAATKTVANKRETKPKTTVKTEAKSKAKKTT